MSLHHMLRAAAGNNQNSKVLLIQKKAYPGGTASLNVDFNAALGGGTVAFTGHPIYGTFWGCNQLFDNTTTAFDWCNLPGTSPLYGEFVFPVAVNVKNIFIVPRASNDNFPFTFTLKVDGAVIGTYNQTTLTSTSGQMISYTGTGFNIEPNVRGTTWRLEPSGSNAYIGEIEFWGTL